MGEVSKAKNNVEGLMKSGYQGELDQEGSFQI